VHPARLADDGSKIVKVSTEPHFEAMKAGSATSETGEIPSHILATLTVPIHHPTIKH
jgi:hypothetical protein